MIRSTSKVRYSEDEAARKLGLSVRQLRLLVKEHIATGEDEPAVEDYQPSDLVMLRILAQHYSHMVQ